MTMLNFDLEIIYSTHVHARTIQLRISKGCLALFGERFHAFFLIVLDKHKYGDWIAKREDNGMAYGGECRME